MKRLAFTLTLLFGLSNLRAGQELQTATAAPPEPDWFRGGAFELELMSGVAGAPIVGDHIGYHYTDTELRLGWMLYSASGSGFFRGNVELLGTVGGGGIFEGPGNKFGKAGAILRYNFVQPSARIIPYFQGGAAVFISDISEDKQQEDIGGTFEADLNAGVGARFLICRSWSLNSELFFEHISNAGTQTRNVGINALGGLVGISRSF